MQFLSFFRLLLALACIDCLFIGPGILIYVFEAFELEAEWYNYLFPIVYPCSEIALCSSIYMTVAIAVERFIGLCRPFRRLSSRPCPAKAYILPVIGLSVLVNIPKFLESETVIFHDVIDGRNVTQTRIGLTSLRTDPNYITYYTMWVRLLCTGVFPLAMLAILNTKIYLALRKSKAELRSLAIRAALPMAILGKPATPPSQMDLRIDSNNWSNGHHVNGIGVTTPLNPPPQKVATPPKSPKPHPMNRSVSAAVVETTRRLREPLTRSRSTSAAATTSVNGHSLQQSNGNGATPSGGPSNDLNLAPVLFGVVIVFVICNALRVFLNMYDFADMEEILKCEKKGVGRMPPPWFVCLVYVSNLMLMVNSSVNFLVYCVAGSKFRTILYQHLSSLFKRFRRPQPTSAVTTTRLVGTSRPFNNGSNEAALLQPYTNNRNGRLISSRGFQQHPRILEINENQV